ncbi:MAG: YggS family pyridoxal phosphate-dependent enzyme [Janthinobacterium lividum]
MTDISQGLREVHQRIEQAAAAAGRSAAAINLLAVSKTFGAEQVRAAYDAGQCAFGENYLQEALAKQDALIALRERLTWHFIGPIQSNKTRAIAERFDWVHAIDRLKIAERLAEQRPAQLPPLQVCIQVNIQGEASKSGVAPDAALELARQIVELPRLRLRGLMSIPEATVDVDAQRIPHRALRELAEQLRANGIPLDTLSMGMSADLEAAVAEGATIVRVGSAIFGSRPRPLA